MLKGSADTHRIIGLNMQRVFVTLILIILVGYRNVRGHQIHYHFYIKAKRTSSILIYQHKNLEICFIYFWPSDTFKEM